MLHKRTLYDIFKLKILLYFVAPVVLTAIIVLTNHYLNSKKYSEIYNEFYVDYTDEVFRNMDNKINTIVNMDYWIKNSDVKNIFESNESISDEDAAIVVEHMNKMKSDFRYIDSIMIVNRKADSVVSTNGNATFDRFFGEVFKYKEYDGNYFRDIRFPADTVVKLPPTVVEENGGEKKYVMPIIKMAAIHESPNSYFIFNIGIDSLVEAHTVSQYTENTSFWFVNKNDKQIYSVGGKSIPFDDKMWDKINLSEQVQAYKDANGVKYSVITKTVSPNLLDYAYLVFIPIKDVENTVSSLTIKIVAVSIFIYLFFVLIVFILASDVSKVFSRLVKPLTLNEGVKMREIFKATDKISREFSRILDENSNMKTEINKMMGDVKEKMITDVLNNKTRQTEMSLYRYDGFLPVVFSIISAPKENENTILTIKERLYQALHKYFNEMYETYDITTLDGDIQFVLNVPQNLDIKKFEKEVGNLAEIISKNELDVDFVYRIGEICDSFENLRDEYLKLHHSVEEGKSLTFDDKKLNSKRIIYRVSESNSIINSILEDDYEKTISFIDRILITNVANDVSSEEMKILYQNIINTMITALRMKNVDVDKLLSDVYSETYFNIGEKSEEDIIRFMLSLIDMMRSERAVNKEDDFIADVINYIDSNYSEYDLTLENVAGKFGIDAKKLSKDIKKYANITFLKYLTELRISEAKRLLLTTDMSIEQIYTNVGYISRTTFIRAFNSVEDMTPSEYRKQRTVREDE